MKRINFFGTEMDASTMVEVVEWIDRRLSVRKFTQHVVVNVAKLVNMRHNPEFAALNSGTNGLLFSYDNAVDLAKQIHLLGSNPAVCHQMGKNALACIHEEFSFEGMIDRFVQAVKCASANAGS